MFRLTISLLFFGLVVSFGEARAEPQIQVFKLFDEMPMVFTGEPGGESVVMETNTVTIVRGERDMVILSSTPDGAGIPNADDYITINGMFVQGGWYIPHMVEALTGTWPEIPACAPSYLVNECHLPYPHLHPVDVSDEIPVGHSTVIVELWDGGGGYGHTELYLIIVPRPLH